MAPRRHGRALLWHRKMLVFPGLHNRGKLNLTLSSRHQHCSFAWPALLERCIGSLTGRQQHGPERGNLVVSDTEVAARNEGASCGPHFVPSELPSIDVQG
jgi:hypothetical protein